MKREIIAINKKIIKCNNFAFGMSLLFLSFGASAITFGLAHSSTYNKVIDQCIENEGFITKRADDIKNATITLENAGYTTEAFDEYKDKINHISSKSYIEDYILSYSSESMKADYRTSKTFGTATYILAGATIATGVAGVISSQKSKKLTEEKNLLSQSTSNTSFEK